MLLHRSLKLGYKRQYILDSTDHIHACRHRSHLHYDYPAETFRYDRGVLTGRLRQTWAKIHLEADSCMT